VGLSSWVGDSMVVEVAIANLETVVVMGIVDTETAAV
jgi:hypothetical protein